MFRPWQVRSGTRYAWILIVPAVLMGTVFAASTSHPTHERSSAAEQQMGTTCIFTAGPKAGSSHDYAPVQMPVNSACNDGAGSTGVIIPLGITQAQPMGTICKFTTGPKAGQTQDYAPMHAPLNTACKDGSGDAGVIIASPVKGETAVSKQMGTVCKFTAGPRAGATQDYAPMEAPLEMPCTDGAGSSGTIISTPAATGAPDSPIAPASPASSPSGTVCKFIAGPKAGTTHDYAPVHAPLDTPCDDGAGSSGVIISTSATGSVCKFSTGPKAGTMHDYAPMHEPLNTPCNDGAGSNGVIVPAPQTSSVCKFTTGPKAGTTHDYAPMHAPLNTPCDDGAGSSGVIVGHASTASQPTSASPAITPAGTASTAAAAATPAPEKPSAPASVAAPVRTTSGSSNAPASPIVGPTAPNLPQTGLGSFCKLTSGPKAGTTYNFAPSKAELGAPCNYGTDKGIVVSSPSSNVALPPAGSQQDSHTACKLTSGPKAGFYFGPIVGEPGASCNDGHGSDGVVVEH